VDSFGEYDLDAKGIKNAIALQETVVQTHLQNALHQMMSSLDMVIIVGSDQGLVTGFSRSGAMSTIEVRAVTFACEDGKLHTAMEREIPDNSLQASP
jgi:hypothetical protein